MDEKVCNFSDTSPFTFVLALDHWGSNFCFWIDSSTYSFGDSVCLFNEVFQVKRLLPKEMPRIPRVTQRKKRREF